MKSRWSCYLACVCILAFWLPAAGGAEDTYEWKDDKWVAAAKPAEGTAAGELALVRHLLKSGRFKKSVKAAKKFRARYPDSDEYEEVCLLAAEAETKRGRYYQAYEWYEKQLNQFPAGQYSDKALQCESEIAETFLSGKKRIVFGFMRFSAIDEALEILTRIAEHAPGTELAAKSLLRVADYHYSKSEWLEATDAYDAFLLLFGKSTKAAYAMLQAARATYASYGGVKFDDTPLLDAEQRFKIFAESFPAAAAKAGVGRILRQIAGRRAHRLYLAGGFYERTRRPSAAAYYYKQTVDQFPRTQWGKLARTALVRLGAIQPQKPAQPAAGGKSASKGKMRK